MYIKNRYVSLVYKIIAILFCIAGQIMTLGIPQGRFEAGQFLYYTNQSNILCMIYLICAAVFVSKQIKKDGKYGPATFAPSFKGAVILAITVTLLIYWGMLSGTDFSMYDGEIINGMTFEFKFWQATNRTVHLIVPVLTVFDWVLFDPNGVFKKRDPIIWTSIPLIYYCFSLIVAKTGYTFWSGSHYPYFFIDSDKLGWAKVAMYVVLLGVGFIILGYIYCGIDKLLGKKSEKKNGVSNGK